MTRAEVARALGLTYKEVKDAELSGLDKCRRYLAHCGYEKSDFFGPPDPSLDIRLDQLLDNCEDEYDSYGSTDAPMADS